MCDLMYDHSIGITIGKIRSITVRREEQMKAKEHVQIKKKCKEILLLQIATHPSSIWIALYSQLVNFSDQWIHINNENNK